MFLFVVIVRRESRSHPLARVGQLRDEARRNK
jgi:hypothetical protein